VVAYLISNRVKNKNSKERPYYKYFQWGLYVKLFAGLAFAAIYLFYYGGGDTVYYFQGSESIIKMLGKNIPAFFKLMAGNISPEVGSMFDQSTGYPLYFHDSNSFAVSRFNVPFYLLGLGSYLGNTIVMNLVLFFGIWRFYQRLVQLYPANEKGLAIAVFFIPSVVFWSSGILKDGWTLTGILFLFTTFYQIFVVKKELGKNLLWLLFWSYIVFSIRPYIFYVTMGSGLIWIGFASLKAIKSYFLRTIAFPLVFLVAWIAGSLILTQTGTMAGQRYSSIESMLETAQIIQEDLKQDYYGGNSFDIGDFEPTIPGIIKKAPKAIIAGVFRPFIWEANNILMGLSGIESFVLIVILAYLLIKTKFLGFFKTIASDPFLIALLVFTFTFAFFVGLTTANFGALVRYRMPVTLFLLILLFNNRKAEYKKESDDSLSNSMPIR